jgi:biopolymer transport protein ExbB/TolQ
MRWLLFNSPWIIAALGVVHVLCFAALWRSRTKQVRRLEAHLRNIVGSFASHHDYDPYNTVDERIDSFVHDIRDVLRDKHRREDQRKLYYRLVTKEESKKYLQGQTFETVYNVLQTFIETYPFWGILGTLLGIGLGLTEQAIGTASNSSSIVRNFGGAIWCTVAGISAAIVLMLLNAALEPGFRRLVEHRMAVRDVIRAAKSELGVAIADGGGGGGNDPGRPGGGGPRPATAAAAEVAA